MDGGGDSLTLSLYFSYMLLYVASTAGPAQRVSKGYACDTRTRPMHKDVH